MKWQFFNRINFTVAIEVVLYASHNEYYSSYFGKFKSTETDFSIFPSVYLRFKNRNLTWKYIFIHPFFNLDVNLDVFKVHGLNSHLKASHKM